MSGHPQQGNVRDIHSRATFEIKESNWRPVLNSYGFRFDWNDRRVGS